MKKVLLIGLLILIWVYGSGYRAFTDANVNKVLNEWEDATRRGDAEATCATFADDMTFALEEHTAESTVKHEGGKDELCAYVRKLLPAMVRAVSSTNVTRDNLTVTRSWLHCWTAEVSYTEHRTTGLASGLSVRTVSDDRLTLVKSFGGVLVRRLESVSRLDEGT